MYHYIKGIVVSLERDHIVLDHHGMGYIIYVPNPYDYKLNQEITIYVYQQVREDAQLLFGFKTADEKALFLKLILVKGIGPKTAQKLIIELKDKLKLEDMFEDATESSQETAGINPSAEKETMMALVALGYSESEAFKALKSISITPDMDSEKILKLALKQMLII